MGNFYTNFIISGAEVEQVVAAAKELNRRVYIAKSKKEIVLYDQICDEQDVDEIVTLGMALSLKLNVKVFGCLNHDDDHFLIWIFEHGNIQSHYESISDAPRFAWHLVRFRRNMLAYPFVLAILAWPTFIFEIFRHLILKSVLSLPAASVGFGYKYLSNGEIPHGISKNDIIQI